VKFHWFHLMPYPELPADFKQRYTGVWVDLPAREVYDPVVGHAAYNDYLDELEFADQMGFDGICVNEHHQNGYGMMPSPNIMAAALARRTRNAKLVLMGDSVALYDPPIRVAEEIAMLDGISGGRVVAGFPVGSAQDACFCYGANPVRLREKYYEAVDFILRAWTAEEPFAWNGKYTKLRYVNPWPRPIQQPHPPVWIPGGGSVETWDYCAKNDFLYAYLSFFGYELARENVSRYWDVVEAHGKELNPYRCGFIQFVTVADSDAEAERLYSDAGDYFFNKCLYVNGGYMNPVGYVSIPTLRRGNQIQTLIQKAASASTPEFTWKDLVERRHVVAGSPDTVVEQLNEIAESLRVGHLMLLLHFGNMSKELTNYNTQRFAEEVMPRLRHHHSEWDDHWFPRSTLERVQEPAPLAETAVA
jgi:alkanesulfonate monooxygenase SsuD/methylene tetrahydromethanopterin reductase-like flavin-dependent oxidoreductase (luciferase family)